MKFRLVLAVLVTLMVTVNGLSAGTIRVPYDYNQIQVAIDNSNDGDTVLVAPGIYWEVINFAGKLITLRSEAGPLYTGIRCLNRVDSNSSIIEYSLVTFENGETTDAILEGFTLRGGWIGIRCINSAPTIRRNILVDQLVTNWAAICLGGCGYAESVELGWAPAVIENNTIVRCANGGISTFSCEAPVIKNNIIAFNKHYGIHRQSTNDSITEHPRLSYNDVYGNKINYYNIEDPGIGTIHADPKLNRSLMLEPDSPCIDAGDPDSLYNDPDGSRNDMGAVPFCGDSMEVVIPTNEWIAIYCSVPVMPPIPPQHIPSGATIRAYDPDGVLCGKGRSNLDGTYQYIPIYRDDIYTDFDEGAEPGDTISLTVNGELAALHSPLIWTNHGETFEVCSYIHERCIRIPLHEGWNLISWDVAYNGPLEELIAEIEDCVDVVLSWSFDQPAVYDPSLEQFSTIEYVYYSQGYWFRMKCEAVLQVCGPEIPKCKFEFDSPWIYLYPGWNIVGYWPEQVMEVEWGFYSILSVLEGADGFEDGALIWRPEKPWLNTLTELKPGFGYLVNVNQMATLIYPGFECDSIMPCEREAMASGNGIPSRHWISIYGEGITLDGVPLRSGDLIEAFTREGVLCGSAMYGEGILKFSPVYGIDGMSEAAADFPEQGEQVRIQVNGEPAYPGIEWEEHGSRIRLEAFYSRQEDVPPRSVAMSQNYPNPFNPGTMIKLEIPTDCRARLTIYNTNGQRIKTLLDDFIPAGRYEKYWDGTNDLGQRVSSGIYFYRLETPFGTETKKMVILR
jgi:parallel beta-helix repeat protein